MKIKDIVIKLLRPVSKLLNKIVLKKYYKANKNLSNIDQSETILIFAPHMDDETIGLGGTIKKHKQANSNIHCVFVTDGGKSVSDLSAQTLSEIRKDEVNKVADLLGIDQLYFMDLPDGEVKSTAETVNIARDYIKDLDPDIIYIPLFVDAHPDHIATAEIIANALYEEENTKCKVRLYEINCAIPPKYINCVIDITDTFKDKVAAIEVFKSQAIHFDGFIELSKLKVHLLSNSKNVKNVEGFIELSPSELYKHKGLVLADGRDYHTHFKQINREETLIWAIYKSKKLKDFLYKKSLSFLIK